MKEPTGHIAAAASRGSALILTVVLTSLLAIVGVLFVMAARIDKMATTATTESRELACAIDTVLAQIEQDLADGCARLHRDPKGPGVLRLSRRAPIPGWPISSRTNPAGKLLLAADQQRRRHPDQRHEEHSHRQGSSASARRSSNSGNAADPDVLADADGDGVADAKWFQVPGVMTSKGKPFYAAVRIIDNGGMLNLNTGFKFDPNDPETPASMERARSR